MEVQKKKKRYEKPFVEIYYVGTMDVLTSSGGLFSPQGTYQISEWIK